MIHSNTEMANLNAATMYKVDLHSYSFILHVHCIVVIADLVYFSMCSTSDLFQDVKLSLRVLSLDDIQLKWYSVMYIII